MHSTSVLHALGKFSGFLLVILVAGTSLCAAERSADLTAVLERKVLRVALPQRDNAPFVTTKEDGTVSGLEPDVARDIARRLEVGIEFIRTARTADDLLAQVRERRADLALGQLHDSLSRAKFVRFTTPYLTLYEVLLLKRLTVAHAHGWEALLAREDSRIAAVAESAEASVLQEEIPSSRLLLLASLDEAVAQLRDGKVTAASTDDVTARHWLRQHPEAAIAFQVKVRRNHPLSIALAMHWEAEDLQAWLNLYLEKAQNDETLRKLTAHYLGDDRLRAEP